MGLLYRFAGKRYKHLSITCIAKTIDLARDDCHARLLSSGLNDFFQLKLIENLFYPFINALVGEFGLPVLINGKAEEMVIVRETFEASYVYPSVDQ